VGRAIATAGLTSKVRSDDTPSSATDPEAKVVRKVDGREAKLAFTGHAAMENRHGLCVPFAVHPAVGASEANVALNQIDELQHRRLTPRTAGADLGYCSRPFIEGPAATLSCRILRHRRNVG